jgi:acyl-CoA thioesterase-1
VSAIADGQKLTIVALGSSSTLGHGRLVRGTRLSLGHAAALAALLQGHEIDVINAGVGGNSAHQMYQRIEADVLSEQPKLVIWQTGVFDAIHDIGIEKFKRILRKGIAMIREGGADVLLMDQLPLPRPDRFPAYAGYVAALHEVAVETDTPVFRRSDLFSVLMSEGRLRPDEMLPTAGDNMVDGSYHCLGVNLARTLAEKLSPRAATLRP